MSVGFLLIFLFIFYVAAPLLISHREQLAALGHIHLGYLALGVLLEAGALAAYTQLTHSVLPPDGPKRFRLFRINMSTLALSHVAPGGTAPGAALGYRLLTQSGVSGADTGFALGTQGIGSAVVLNAIFWLALVAFVFTHGFHAPTSHGGGTSESGSILVVVAAAIGVVLLGAFGGIFYLLTRGQERAAEVVKNVATRLRLRHPDRIEDLVRRLALRFSVLLDDRPLLIRAGGWAAANWLLDAASLWVFVAAFSHFIPPVDLLVAYGLANILAAVPITPGGLGVVEFVLVSMITGFGPTAGEALSGVLAYRAVNFWLPIPFGGLAYASLELERGTLYRRLSLFFFHRYQRRRGEDPGGPGDPGGPATSGPAVGPPGAATTSDGPASAPRSGPTSPAAVDGGQPTEPEELTEPTEPKEPTTVKGAAPGGAARSSQGHAPESTLPLTARPPGSRPAPHDGGPGASGVEAGAAKPAAAPGPGVGDGAGG